MKTMKEISLITVYDNYQVEPEFKTGWGFSCLVRQSLGESGFNILFDTGADSHTLFSNMEKLKIDPKSIDFVFISHMHGDHTGGLQDLLEFNKGLKVYTPDLFSEPTKIFKNVYSTGWLEDWVKEQSLILNTEKGLVIITGCAHPGIINIIKKVKDMLKREVYLVLGGFHLSGTSDSELKEIIDDFKRLEVQKTAPCHCSGDRCRELFKQEYKNNFIENGVGKIINIQ
ncbi:MBL fold metallo-hydrolase [Candidatus Parcubacteria bacterium]|nr:MBL fold metallo-hydrolase [Candidatus Parcubacteria bacterium]